MGPCALVLVLSCAAPAVPTASAQGASAADAVEAELSALERQRALTLGPLPAPPPDPTNAVADSELAARLGQALFFDARLSRNQQISCATCHDPARAFADGRRTARGLGDLARNTPSLLAAPWQRWFFWDGRADTLWSQALQPIEHVDEMGSTRLDAVRLVARDELLRRPFVALFGALPALENEQRFPPAARAAPRFAGDPAHAAWLGMAEQDRAAINRAFGGLGKAIAAYQRRLIAAPAPFDRFLERLRDGAPAAQAGLEPAALRGLRLFVGKAGCRACHNGPTLSDGEFHDIGLAAPGGRIEGARHDGLRQVLESEFNAAGPYSDERQAGRAEDLRALVVDTSVFGAFRTPSLRNVARTAPYMHDGSLASLDDVLRFYSTREGARAPGHHGETVLAALHLDAEELADLKAFLESLSAPDPPAEWLAPPRAGPPVEGG